MVDFKKRLHDLRVDSDMSQKELGEKLGLKGVTISKYEIGGVAPQMKTIIQLSRIFDVSTDYLLGLSSVKKPNVKHKFKREEIELIIKYRKLDDTNKIRLDERVSSLLDSQENKQQS